MMQTSLERIAKKSRENKAHRFRNVYGLLNEELILDSWKALNKKAAAGVDGVDYDEYQKNHLANISGLVRKLKEKRYKAKLVRRQYIPKSNGKMRPLGIPAMEDKLVQHGAARILMTVYEQDFEESFYGYRPGRGAKGAVKDIREKLQNGGYNYVVEADIKGFFDNMCHEWLIKMLEQRIDDKAFIRLIKKWLKAGVLDTDGKVIHPLTGTPQGGIISPVLANIYLHYVLGLWFERVVKKRCKGKASLWAYADDFICAFEERDDAERCYRVLGKRLEKFNLELSVEKTKIIYFGRWSEESFDFLGFEFRVGRTRTRAICIRTSRKKLRDSISNVTEWCRINRHKRLRTLFELMNMKLRGYYNYFGLQGNSKSLYMFHYAMTRALYKWLNRRSQKRSLNWEQFTKALDYYKIVQPYVEASNGCLIKA